MVNLCISGSLEKDIILFSYDGQAKAIDPFCKNIYFSLEEKQTCRIHFEQKTEQYIPRYAEMVLSVLFLPIRGIINAITFNVDQNWEKDISAFKISGYIDVNLIEDTEIFFKLTPGSFNEGTNRFQSPIISFSPNVLTELSTAANPKEITKEHCSYLKNIMSASVLLFPLLLYLLSVALNNHMYIACIFTSFLVIAFSVLVGFLVLHSFKKKAFLLTTLLNQQSKEQS